MGENGKDSQSILQRLLLLAQTDRLGAVAAILGVLLSLLAALLSGPDALFELMTLFSRWFHGSTSMIVPAAALVVDVVGPGGKVDVTSFDPRPVIELAIFVVLFVAFFWCLYISLHSDNKDKVKIALDVVKMLFGFMIGAATRYLGG